MRPKTQLFLSIAAMSIGLGLLVGLLLGEAVLENPAEVFLGVLLLAGGATFLWLRGKSALSRKSATGDLATSDVRTGELATDDLLSQFLRK